jgi:hypothetical protein
MEERGVSVSWLLGFVRAVWEKVNAEGDEFYFLTTHGLVNRVVKPLTAHLRAPLYALVPPEDRGRPTTFVSHTWSSLLVGPDGQPIGTLDALEQLGNERVWIDFACYNQHIFEAIGADMQRVIAAIGSISVVATPTPIYRRCWCLWELLCAQRAGVPVHLLVRGGYRNDKILSVNALYRSFQGVGRAEATKPEDREILRAGIVAHFGSVARADVAIEALIREKFSGDWCELQDPPQELPLGVTPA